MLLMVPCVCRLLHPADGADRGADSAHAAAEGAQPTRHARALAEALRPRRLERTYTQTTMEENG